MASIKKWAVLNDDGYIVEIIELSSDVGINDSFTPQFVARMRDITDVSSNPQVGWKFDGKVYALPTPVSQTQIDLAAYAAKKRYEVETNGVTWILLTASYRVDTTRESQGMIIGAVLAATINPAFTTSWKMKDGSFVDLTAANVQALGSAVFEHVNACFAVEKTALAAIAAGTVTSIPEINALFHSLE